MMKKTCAYFLIVLALVVMAVVIGFLLLPCPDVIVTTENNGILPLGTVEIPSAGIHTLLYPIQVDTCCDTVLWNGGRIHSDDEAIAGIKLLDTAKIKPEGMVLECVSIEHCVQIGTWLVGWKGVIRPGGDVLIVYGNTVYRFTLL